MALSVYFIVLLVIIINENIDQTDWEYEQLRREYLWPTREGLIIG